MEEVVALSNAQQLVAEADALWPRHLYAATLRRKRVLVFGASSVHLDALLLARHGAHVTVLDGDEANLRAFRVLLEAAAVDEAYVDLAHHTGAAYLDTLGREYDAVVVLDRRVSVSAYSNPGQVGSELTYTRTAVATLPPLIRERAGLSVAVRYARTLRSPTKQAVSRNPWLDPRVYSVTRNLFMGPPCSAALSLTPANASLGVQ